MSKKPKPRRKGPAKRSDLEAIYAWSRARFSAADLQRYTVIEKGVPLERVIEAMEKIQRTPGRKKG